MYYKITRKESELYQRLLKLLNDEKQMEQRNWNQVKAICTPDWEHWIGYPADRNLLRVNIYIGFMFKEPELVCKKTWTPDREEPEYFVPNRRTRLGREMYDFLNRGLERSSVWDVFDILKVNFTGKFTIPLIEIAFGEILLSLDHRWNIEHPDLVEITQKEYLQKREMGVNHGQE